MSEYIEAREAPARRRATHLLHLARADIVDADDEDGLVRLNVLDQLRAVGALLVVDGHGGRQQAQKRDRKEDGEGGLTEKADLEASSKSD